MKRTLRAMIPAAILASAASAAGVTAGAQDAAVPAAPGTASPRQLPAVCASINKGIAQHIEAMRALKEKIQKEPGVPRDVESLFEHWAYAAPPPPTDNEAKLAKERRMAEEIAALLRAYNCPPVDIDAELEKPMTSRPKPEAASTAHKSHKRKLF